MHVLAIYVKEVHPFARDLSLRKVCRFLFMFFIGFTSSSALFLFPLSILLYTIFDAFESNIDQVSQINPSANGFVFKTLFLKDLLTLPSETDRHGELIYNFSISNDLTDMV